MAIAEFLVSFREVFEIGLALGIMLAYLQKTGRTRLFAPVYAGVLLAVFASAAAAVAFEVFAGGFEKSEPLFEGVALVLACAMVSWLNLWVVSGSSVRKKVQDRLDQQASKGRLFVAAFSFLAVFREGVELAVFLGGIALSSGALDFGAALAGALAAGLLAYALFRQAIRLDLQNFFKITSILLALLAAGLLSQGVHELQEAGAMPASVEHIYDITPQVEPGQGYPLLHEKGAVGGALKILVGYSTAPSLEQAASYALYLAAAYAAYHRIESRGRL
jgi:high-affinity iron transporter